MALQTFLLLENTGAIPTLCSSQILHLYSISVSQSYPPTWSRATNLTTTECEEIQTKCSFQAASDTWTKVSRICSSAAKSWTKIVPINAIAEECLQLPGAPKGWDMHCRPLTANRIACDLWAEDTTYLIWHSKERRDTFEDPWSLRASHLPTSSRWLFQSDFGR